MIDVVFAHGWSFDARIWSAVLPLLRDVKPHLVDMGFTGNPYNAEAPLPKNAVLVGHSYGAAWLLEHLPQNPLGFISIAGFDCFHKYKAEREIRAMKMALRRDPARLIEGFYTLCGAPDLYDGVEPQEQRLLEGLEKLETTDTQEQREALSCPIIALAATQDSIVPAEMSRKIWAQDQLHWLETKAHALPHSHAQWCATQIQRVIDAQRA
jgi:pimeloyl-[acyl-carrier protein] methyl ester esterase